MKEFGSDFHRCESDYIGSANFFDHLGDVRYYADGRLAIDAIIEQEKWKRIWIPAYFCYEVIEHLASTGIEIKLYDDHPLREDDDVVVRNLQYNAGDVLLRVNYFGLRNKRSNNGISVPVVEDHTHDLMSEWAIKSDADWCIASIRKTLPVAAGGVLWSPKQETVPQQPKPTSLCEQMAHIRYEAMDMKKEYLRQGGDKNAFREKYLLSEEMIDKLQMSDMDQESYRIATTMNVRQWTDLKSDNWDIAYKLLKDKFRIMPRGEYGKTHPFSLVILCKDASERTALRNHLIHNQIYPAILWQMPTDSPFKGAADIATRMLSVHCDSRYSAKDIEYMCQLINGFYD